MRGLAILAVLCTALAGSAVAEETGPSPLHSLMTAYEARGWEGVGRLNIGYGGMCTGALVAPRLVLTAAHCLYDERTFKTIDPTTIQFLAGWRNGRATAYRGVRRAVVHPDFEYTGPAGELRVSNDLALLELDSEIRLSNVQPFKTAGRPRKGTAVGVVSYAHDRAETLSIQEVCHVLARREGALILSCDVDFGSSGAPVFAEVDGEPRIVSVVSAKAVVDGHKVSLGTSLEKPLGEMMAMLDAGQGLVAADAPRRQMPGGLQTSGGAKFLRP